jgi:carboxypeptidase Taq
MTKTRKAKTSKAKIRKAKTREAKTRRAATRKTQPPSSKRNRRSVESKLAELKSRLGEIADLGSAGALLEWDQATYMPPGGALARARQGALLRKCAHERSIDPALGRLIDELIPHADGLPDDADDAALIRVARRDFEKAIRVPPEHVARVNALGSASYDAWTRARPANDFAAMRPFLEQALELSRSYADFFAPYDHVADPLIDEFDEGMTAASVRALFAELEAALVPLVRAICEQAPADDSCLHGSFGEKAQLDLSLRAAEAIGYDLGRGRLDTTHHPFCTKFALGDVRITTRVREHDVTDALFSTMHEAGHALYEQGVAAAFEGTPLGRGTSAGVHESQSRLWENVVGRSRGFCHYFYPVLQQSFPGELARVELDAFYRAINKVARSLIRTDADEVTYNLHVMLRFELELAMLEGRLRVADLPEAWREGMRERLGIATADDRDGCLQDVHWYMGVIGGVFQGYTIGNILAAQCYDAALSAHPEIPGEIERGSFATLRRWLTKNVYRYGRKYQPNELIERATGTPLRTEPYLAYLHTKYGELYRLPAPTIAVGPAHLSLASRARGRV